MSPQVFTLPDLGEGLTEATVARWLVTEGDAIAVDAPIAEVETDKAMVEVPSPFGGTVARRHGEEGTTIAVGDPLISVETGSPTGDGDATVRAGDTAGRAGEVRAEEERAGSGHVLIGYGTSAPTPSRRRRGARRGDAEREPRREDTRPAVISPIVRGLARRHDIDLRALTGTGPGGVITRHDVEAARDATAMPAVPAEPAQPAQPAEPAGNELDRRTGLAVRTRVPVKGVRKAVTETLTRSRLEIPEATTWVDVDATALLALRTQLAGHGDPPSVLAMIARFVVAGLRRHPELNSRVDTERGEIVHLDGINLGLAVQTDRGLLVPAVRDAHRLGMRGLHTEIRRLTAAAREGHATVEELSSSSFTLNNYGVLGVDGSAAIINHPEVAILGIGRIISRPWVVDGEIVARQIVQLSLAFDHRVCDGAAAGGFLRFVADAVEAPTSAVADL